LKSDHPPSLVLPTGNGSRFRRVVEKAPSRGQERAYLESSPLGQDPSCERCGYSSTTHTRLRGSSRRACARRCAHRRGPRNAATLRLSARGQRQQRGDAAALASEQHRRSNGAVPSPRHQVPTGATPTAARRPRRGAASSGNDDMAPMTLSQQQRGAHDAVTSRSPTAARRPRRGRPAQRGVRGERAVNITGAKWGIPGAQDRRSASELGLARATYDPGAVNAITDVPGVRIGHTTLVEGELP
jgi:hypothetical protein